MILAIDPGSEQSAFVVWDGAKTLDKGKISNNAMLGVLYTKAIGISCLVVEMIGHYGTGMPAGKTVFDTCLWIGRFVQKWVDCNNPNYKLVMRREVKLDLCGNSRAKDGNIRQAIIDRFGPPGTIKAPNAAYGETNKQQDKMKADLWQALALAVYFWETFSSQTSSISAEGRGILWDMRDR